MDNIIFEIVLIFAGAAILATLFLYLRQPIILAYIALGVAIGPSGAGLMIETFRSVVSTIPSPLPS